MFEDFNLGKNDKYYLLGLLIFSALLTAHYINFNLNIGVSCSDVYIYLINALYYTGINRHATGFIYLSPLICFLTSILFRLGLVDVISIYIVTGIFAILGNIGLYLLLKRFFDENLSMAGAIIYSTLTLNLTWFANGTLDIPAVAMTIWIALFSVIAIDKNPKYYIYAIPLIVIGFFTRYTIIFTMAAILLYYVYVNGFKIKSEDWKYIKRGIIIGLIVGIIILATILIMSHGQMDIINQMTNGISGKRGGSTDPAYNTDLGYYLVNFPNFISNSHTVFEGNPVLENPTVLSWAVIAMLAIGALLWGKDNRIKLEKKHAIPIALFLIAILTYTRVSSVITILITLLGMYMLGKDSENKMGYVMATWIIVNFIFYSYYNIKVNRYIIPVFPAFIYFVIKAADHIQKNVKIDKRIIPIILIVLFAIQGFAFTQTFEPTDKYIVTEEISNYIIDNNPDYQDIPIGTYNIRPYRWWIGDNVVGIPNGEHDTIDSSNLTYYISNSKIDDFENYTEIKNIGNLYLYEKITT